MSDTTKRTTAELNTTFLLFITARQLIKKYQEELDKVQLSYFEYLVLLALPDGKDEGMTITQICTTIHIEPGSISPYIKNLCTKKLVFKRHNKRDKRSFIVKLTNEGKEMKAKMEELEKTILEKSSLDIGQAEDIGDKVFGYYKEVYKNEKY
ncbi:MAG: winged helix DNA-binding protein [Clostridia bacterium]|nr:winged helix DNA-binding protein [Clostridia bacterium]